MPPPLRRSLERIGMLARALALLIGFAVGAQIFARGSGPGAAVLAGAVVTGLAYALLSLVVRHYRRIVADMEEGEEPRLPPPRRSASARRSRRVLTDEEDRGSGASAEGARREP